MKKRIIAICVVLLLALSMTAYAVEQRGTSIRPELSFNGTTAVCSATIISNGDEITATLTLYRGQSRIGTWSGSGRNILSIEGQCEVKEGLEYRLELSGSIDGTSFDSVSVTGTCGG